MPTLIIANKAYSSWSMRPWLLMTAFGLPFDEVVISMGRPETRAEMLRYAPTGKCPALVDGPVKVWESLAIIEYLAETHPERPVWPRERGARASARSLCSEMHAGFPALRQQCPTNYRRQPKPLALSEATQADVARIEGAWSGALKASGGPFLFGDFGAADAMFAPVVNRFHAYAVTVQASTQAYMKRMMALPAWRAWEAGAQAEPWRLAHYENL